MKIFYHEDNGSLTFMSYIEHSNFGVWNLLEYWSNFSVVSRSIS